MSGNNDWFGKLKSRAKSVQESAKTSLVKLSDTVDKKLKEAQDDLERQRAKTDAPSTATSHLQRWRPSAEHPDGEIVAEEKPVPVVQPPPTPLPSSPLLPPPPEPIPEPTPESTPLENSEPVSPPEELLTIKHRGKKKNLTKRSSIASASSGSMEPETDSLQDQKLSSFKKIDSLQESQDDSNNTKHQIEKNDSNELINKISTVGESVENVIINATPPKEEPVPVQNSTNKFENSTDSGLEQSISSATKVNQENIQTDISDDKLTSVTTADISSTQHSDVENIPVKVSNDEPSISTNIGDVSTTSFVPTNTSIPVEKDEPSTSMNIDNSTHTQDPVTENNQTELRDDELSTSTDTTNPSDINSDLVTIPTNIVHDDTSSPTDIDQSVIENFKSEEDTPIETSLNEVSSTTDIENSSSTKSSPEDVSIITLVDEIPSPSAIADSPTIISVSEAVSNTTPVDETSSTEHNVDSSTLESDPEDIPKTTPVDKTPSMEYNVDASTLESSPEDVPMDEPVDEPTSTANSADLSNLNSDLEDISKITSVADEVPLATNTVDSLTADSDLEDTSTTAYSNSENMITITPMDETTFTPDIVDSEDIPTVTSADERTSTSDTSDSTSAEFISEDVPIVTSANEITLTEDTVDSTIVNSDVEDNPVKDIQNELLTSSSSDDEDLPIVNSNPENLPTNASDDESTTLMKADEIPNIHVDSDNIPTDVSGDENSVLSDIHKSSFEYLGPEDIPTQTTVDEELTTVNTDDTTTDDSESNNIISNVLDDKLSASTSTDNLSNIQSEVPEKNQKEISNDKSITSSDSEELLLEPSDTKTTSTNTLEEDELPTTTPTTDASILKSSSENISTDVPNNGSDKQSTSPSNDDSLIGDSDLEDLPVKISHDELKTIQTDTSKKETSSTKKVDDSFFDQLESDDEFLILTKAVKPKSKPIDLHETEIIIPQTKIKTPPNELEDSFDELKISNNPVVQTPETPRQSSIHLDALRNFIATIKDDDDDDDDNEGNKDEKVIPSKQDSKILENSVSNTSEQITKSSTPKTTEALLQSIPTSDEIPQEITDQTFTRIDSTDKSPSIDETNKKVRTEPAETNPFEEEEEEDTNPFEEDTNPFEDDTHPLEKSTNPFDEDIHPLEKSTNPFEDDASPFEGEGVNPFEEEAEPPQKDIGPLVNCYSIPPGTKIQHMACSSTYIYLCTTDQRIFFAKLNLDDMTVPLKWQQYSESAEQLVVSNTNRTVWRLLNKHVYTAKDPLKTPPLGTQWNLININNGQQLLSMSINDQCGWYIRQDGTLWLIRTDGVKSEPINVACPFHLQKVFCFSEKVGVITKDGEILIRVGCNEDCLEGDGWVFVEHEFGRVNDFAFLNNNNLIIILDKKHQLWMQQWPSEKGFYEIICKDEYSVSQNRYLFSVNSELLCYTDCAEQIRIFSNALAGYQWNIAGKNTRFQRLVGAFSNEDFVWGLTTDRKIRTSIGQILDKPRQAQYLTHATFVPNNTSQNTVLWTLDESCTIYVRDNVEKNTHWEQADRTQFEWTRRLVNIVCNHAGVWAVDDQGSIHFRHGHISASQHEQINEQSLLPPAWITIPGEPEKHRMFAQVFCGPTAWMVYATDNKQNVYTREGINADNRVGTHWKIIEDCSALELSISSQTLWLLTSHGQIQCRENISIENPVGTRSTTLPGFFLSLAASMDDSQVWALDSKRNLLKLERLTVSFEK